GDESDEREVLGTDACNGLHLQDDGENHCGVAHPAVQRDPQQDEEEERCGKEHDRTLSRAKERNEGTANPVRCPRIDEDVAEGESRPGKEEQIEVCPTRALKADFAD